VPADSVSIRIYSGIARFPCDSMAFLYRIKNALVDRGADVEQTEFAIFSCHLVGIRYFSVLGISLPTSHLGSRYRYWLSDIGSVFAVYRSMYQI